MRRFFALAALIFVGVIAWRIGGMLSSDALGMAVGMVFGVMAGIPAALLVLATGRRRTEADEEDRWATERSARQLPAYPYQPPVIVVTGASQPHQQGLPPGGPSFFPAPHAGSWNAAGRERQFRLVGEQEEWVE